MVRTRSAQDAGIDTMPTYLQEAVLSVLLSKLEEFTRPGAGEPSASLKRILDRASQLLPIPRDDQASSSGVSGQICRHKCEYHEELLDPSLWGNLPNKILFQIFARLPLPKIIGLQVMSHGWKAEFELKDDDDSPPHSDFLQVCDEVHPKVALITRDHANKFWVRLLDVKFNKWHAFQIVAGDAHAVDITATSENGGLVCFISSLKKSKSRTFLIDVVNPLTQSSCALPPLHNFSIVQMVQIVVDPETKAYRVLVVGEAGTGTGNMVAKVYDQSVSTEKWIAPTKQKLFVFGYGYHWGNLRYSQKRDSPCAYDFSAKRLRFLKEGSPLETQGVKNFALLGDRLYVLKKGRDGPNESDTRYYGNAVLYIVEFSAKLGAKEEWVKIKNHPCKPFQTSPRTKYDLSLFACQGFLIVLARLNEEDPYRNEVGWLYNLATCQWSDLPSLPGEKRYHVDDLMCRLHWNISV